MATPVANPTPALPTSPAPVSDPVAVPRDTRADEPIQTPRLLRASVMSPNETLLRETRATKWYYLPGPVFATLFFAVLAYAAGAAYFSWPAFPYLTQWILNVGTPGGLRVSEYLALFFGVAVWLSLLWLLIRYGAWVRNVYAVTTSRVIIQRGIFSRQLDEIPISQVRAVQINQGLIERLLGFGTVRVTSEQLNPIANEAWRGIPQPFEFQRLINGAAGKQGR
ncbi:MAG: PH domain-containing protein [Thermoplasmata archaeon]|nr:PH domain-containing protein [Thermoplasmata archaeon]